MNSIFWVHWGPLRRESPPHTQTFIGRNSEGMVTRHWAKLDRVKIFVSYVNILQKAPLRRSSFKS